MGLGCGTYAYRHLAVPKIVKTGVRAAADGELRFAVQSAEIAQLKVAMERGHARRDAAIGAGVLWLSGLVWLALGARHPWLGWLQLGLGLAWFARLRCDADAPRLAQRRQERAPGLRRAPALRRAPSRRRRRRRAAQLDLLAAADTEARTTGTGDSRCTRVEIGDIRGRRTLAGRTGHRHRVDEPLGGGAPSRAARAASPASPSAPAPSPCGRGAARTPHSRRTADPGR